MSQIDCCILYSAGAHCCPPNSQFLFLHGFLTFGTVLQILFCELCVDGNDEEMLFAWVLVESENTSLWAFFISQFT
jgi:hypothetical protein